MCQCKILYIIYIILYHPFVYFIALSSAKLISLPNISAIIYTNNFTSNIRL